MSKFISPFWEAVGMQAGMIIGSGVFALPYAIKVSGTLWGFVSMLLAFLAVLAVHLAYGEIVSNTTEAHRLPGYSGQYLGRWAGLFERFSQAFSFNAILLVYAIFAGDFMNILWGGGSVFNMYIFLVCMGALFLFSNIRSIGIINIFIMVPLILLLIILSASGLYNGSASNIWLTGSNPFFAFGVFLFALAGMSVIPEIKDLVSRSAIGDARVFMRKVITTGTVLPFVLYILFVFGVLSVLGGGVTENAIIGLEKQLGHTIIIIGAIVGMLAVTKSYILLGYDLKEIYELDFGLTKLIAWALISAVPLFVFLLGANSPSRLISYVGGIFVALDGIFIVLILRKMRRILPQNKNFLPFGAVIQVALVAVFIVSALSEVLYQIRY